MTGLFLFACNPGTIYWSAIYSYVLVDQHLTTRGNKMRKVLKSILAMAGWGVLSCSGALAQTTPPPTLTDVSFLGGTFYMNVGGSPRNIFPQPVPSGASLKDCSITSPSPPLATYDSAGILGPTITVSAAATGTTQAVQHTFTCGSVSKFFVVKPPTYPADIELSGAELKVGDATNPTLSVKPFPTDTVLPTCSITGNPLVSTVTVDRTLGTIITLLPSADAITTDAKQTVMCGSLSKTFNVKAKVFVPATDLKLSGSFINIGGTPQNIFVTPVPADASLSNCSITSPATPLATFSTAGLLGPTITLAANTTATAEPVQHTLSCGSLRRSFVVKPATYPEDIALSGTELKAGSVTPQSLTVTPLPAGTVLPTCSITGSPVLSAVKGTGSAGTIIELTPAADNNDADTKQTVTCGTLSKSFTVKPKEFGPPTGLTIVGAITMQSNARTTLTATAQYAGNRQRTVAPVWSSSNPVAAAVSSAGVVAAGVVSVATDVTISAKLTESGVTVESSHVITVFPSSSVLTELTLSGASSVQSAGQVRLVTNAVYADRSTKAVPASFSLSNPALGSVNSRGILTVVSVANDTLLTVTASYQEGGVTKTASLPITITATPAVLSRLTLVGATALLASGQSLNLSALGVYSDTSSKPVSATWRVSGTAATVSSTGLFQASSVSVDTPVVVSATYTEAGVTVDAQFQVIIQASVPPSPIQAEVQATGTTNSFSLAIWTSASEFSSTGGTTRAGATRSGRPVYKLYVVTRIPGGQLVPTDTIVTLNRNSEWQALSFPVAEYLNGVADNSVQLVQILDKVDASLISGSKIYIGYGVDDMEMISSGRFRLVYQIQ
jgi:hypothetical protein